MLAYIVKQTQQDVEQVQALGQKQASQQIQYSKAY